MAETTRIKDRPPRGESAPRNTGNSRRASGAKTAGDGAQAPPGVAPAVKLTGDERKLHESLTRFYAMLGMGMQTVATLKGDVGMAAAGVNVIDNADGAADAWLELARQNPRVKAMLSGFVQGGAVAQLAAVHVAMLVPILGATGVVPADMANLFISENARNTAGAMWAQQHAAAATAAASGNGTPAA